MPSSVLKGRQRQLAHLFDDGIQTLVILDALFKEACRTLVNDQALCAPAHLASPVEVGPVQPRRISSADACCLPARQPPTRYRADADIAQIAEPRLEQLVASAGWRFGLC